jgi:hypothetical protein
MGCTCMHVWVTVFSVCVHAHACVCTNMFMLVCRCVCSCMYTHVHGCISVSVYAFVCACVYVWLCMCVWLLRSWWCGISFFFSFFGETRVWTQGLSLLGKYFTILATPPTLSALVNFQIGSLLFAWANPRLWSSYFCLLCSWDYSCVPPYTLHLSVFLMHCLWGNI